MRAVRLAGDESLRKAWVSSAVGKVPITSRKARRTNTASVQGCAGSMPRCLSFAKTRSSMRPVERGMPERSNDAVGEGAGALERGVVSSATRGGVCAKTARPKAALLKKRQVRKMRGVRRARWPAQGSGGVVRMVVDGGNE